VERIGEKYFENKVQSSGISPTDIVQLQNKVGASMDQLAAEYYAIRDAGHATAAVIQQYESAMSSLVNSFCVYCSKLGTVRAHDACQTITYYANLWNADREKEKGGSAVSSGTVIDPVTGQPVPVFHAPGTLPGVSTLTTYLPVLLGAIGIYAMLKAARKA
jgi:hypothetical protein